MKKPRIYLPIGVKVKDVRPGNPAPAGEPPRCQRCGRPLVLENGVPLFCWCGIPVGVRR